MKCLKRFLRKKMSSRNHTKDENCSESDPLLRPEKSTITASDFMEEEVSSSSGGPDGIRSWVVALAITSITTLMSGQARVASILFLDFRRVFHVNRKMASAPYSVKQAAKNLCGPLAGILGQKYGVRAVVMSGGIISALSSMSCYFVSDITWIIILWGFVGGMANGFTSSINQVVIDKYFKVYRTSASGLAFSGACIGAIFFSSIIGKLVTGYGLNGAFLILGSMTLFVVPSSILLSDPPWLRGSGTKPKHGKSSEKPESSKLNNEISGQMKPSNSGNGFESASTSTETQSNISNINFLFLQQNTDLVCQLIVLKASERNEPYPEKKVILQELYYMYKCLQRPETEAGKYIDETRKKIQNLKQNEDVFSSKIIDSASLSEVPKSNYHVDSNRTLYVPIKLIEISDLDKFGLFNNLSDPNLSDVLDELKTLSRLFTEEKKSVVNYNTFSDKYIDKSDDSKSTSLRSCENKNAGHPNTIFTHIKTAIKLHSNPLFLLVCLCRGIYMLTFTPVLTAGVDFAIDKGLRPQDGIYVVGVLSIGDLIGRLCTGWITDRRFLSLERYMLLVMVIQGISTATLPFCHNGVLLPALGIFAFLQGSLFVRHPVAVAKYLRSHEKSIGVGFINLPAGIVGFILPSYIGYFRDDLGSYDHMFFINGIICAVAGLIWAFEPCLLKYLPDKVSSNTKHADK